MTGKTIRIGVALVVAAVALSAVGVRASDYQKTIAMRKLQRKAELFRKSQQYANESSREWTMSRVIDGGSTENRPSFDTPIIHENSVSRLTFASTAAGVPVTPGQDIAMTTYDYQANSSQAYSVARVGGGSAIIHFTWMSFKEIPESIEQSNRFTIYGYWTDPQNYPTMSGGTYNDGDWSTGALQRGGYCNIDVTLGNFAAVGSHNAENDYLIDPYRPVVTAFPIGGNLPQVYALGGQDNTCPGSGSGTGGVLWPRVGADRSSLFIHEIAHSNVNNCPVQKLWYWRFNPGTGLWSTPAFISATDEISYALAVSGTNDNIAIVTHGSTAGYTNVFYLESTNNGTNWLAFPAAGPPPAPTQISSYSAAAGTQTASLHLTTTYDQSGTLHAMWDEQQASGSDHVAIKHWNKLRGTVRDVTFAYWDNPVSNGVFTDNLSKLSMGIGDGATTCGGSPNLNYVYCTYTQMGGNTAPQLNDYSDEASVEGRNGGYMNGEVYLVASNSGGNTWSPAVNLTNTKTPGCNPGVTLPHQPDPTSPNDCASEHWATMNRVVSDLDVLFIVDRDAGGIPQGEGSWQQNPVQYLKLSGPGLTTAGGVCPVINPVFAPILEVDATCEYHATRAGFQEIDLAIHNTGNAALNQGGGAGIVVTDFPGLPTLAVVGGTGSYTVAAGAGPALRTVTMTANNAAEGLYTGQISISHNDPDPDNLSPRLFPIAFFVFDEFFCPVDEIFRTSVASPGVLALAIGSDGRFARQTGGGTLWRHLDSAQALSDGSLLLAHGTQGPGVDDTTVFLYYADRASNGQNGWRSMSELATDSLTTYGTHTGFTTASAYMCTSDSMMGCNMTWWFPQDPSLDEVVICKYTIFPGPKWVPGTSPAITNVAVGTLTDFDVFPSQHPPLDTSQESTNNIPVSDPNNLNRELAFFSCKPKPGYITGASEGPNDPRRYNAGILAPSGYEGSYTGFFAQDLEVGGGPRDGRLYFILKNVSGAEIAAAVPPNTSDTDRYVLIGLERDQTYGSTGSTYEPVTVHEHVIILVSDTVGKASFLANADAAAALVGFPYPGAEKAASALAGPFQGCGTCPCRYDPNCDGVTSITDVSHIVNGAFRNVVVDPALAIQPRQAKCNFDSRDVDADGVITILDVSKSVNVAFRNVQGNAANTYVNPCTRWKKWNP